MTPLYPEITIKLVGKDGNAFAIIARVREKLRKGRCSSDVIEKFTEEATSSDYNHLLQTCMKYVNVK